MDDEQRQRSYVVNGWNITGDTYRHDEDGYFWFQARADDMIISAGYNIAGPEVEAALLGHDAVAECAVVAAPDEARGNIVKVFVVLRDGHERSSALATTLQDFVKQAIAPYKYPRAIEFVDELPKTPHRQSAAIPAAGICEGQIDSTAAGKLNRSVETQVEASCQFFVRKRAERNQRLCLEHPLLVPHRIADHIGQIFILRNFDNRNEIEATGHREHFADTLHIGDFLGQVGNPVCFRLDQDYRRYHRFAPGFPG